MELNYDRMWFLGLNPTVRLNLEDLLTVLNLEDPIDTDKMNQDMATFAERKKDNVLIRTEISHRRVERFVANITNIKKEED
jgi:hypothetical protein